MASSAPTELGLRNYAARTVVAFLVLAALWGAAWTFAGFRLIGTPGTPRTKARHDIAHLGTALDLYKLETGQFPDELGALLEPGPKSPDGLLRKLPKDPWGNHYQYVRVGQSYRLYSLGADRKVGGEGEDADVRVDYGDE